jgi:hypothetical protein
MCKKHHFLGKFNGIRMRVELQGSPLVRVFANCMWDTYFYFYKVVLCKCSKVNMTGICLFVKSARGDLDLGNYKAMPTLKDDIKLSQVTHCTVIVLAFSEEAIGQSISVTVARTICTQLAGVHIATSVSSVIISLPGIYNLPSISPLLCVYSW